MSRFPTAPRTARVLSRAGVAALVGAAPLAFAGTASAASQSTWESLAACESSQQWHVNTGNWYYGGLRFSDSLIPPG